MPPEDAEIEDNETDSGESTTPETPVTPATSEGAKSDKAADTPEDTRPVKAKDFAAIMKAKQAALRAAQAAKAAKEQADRERESASKATSEAQRAREEAEASKNGLRELLVKDPAKALEQLGLDKQRYFEAMVKGGETSVEEKLAQFEQAFQERLKKLDEREAKAKEREAQIEAQAQERRAMGAVQQFAGHLLEKPTEYPFLNIEHTREEIAAQTLEIVKWANENGHRYSDEEVARFLEDRAKQRYTDREERQKRVRPVSSEPDAEGSAQPANGTPRVPGRTLTNKGSTSKASAPREMTDAEKDAWALEELRAATAKDRKARA